MEVKFKKPCDADLRYVAATMRSADVAEIKASHGFLPYDALLNGVDQSEFCVVAHINDEPVCVLGLNRRDFVSGIGVPWMLGSNSVMKYKREILLYSPKIIREMLSLCETLINYVHTDNKMSIRWLKWLGFKIDDPQPAGINGELFHKFHMNRGV